MKHLLLAGLILLFGACASIPQIPEPPKALSAYNPPAWVLVGGGAFTDEKGKAFIVSVRQLELKTFLCKGK